MWALICLALMLMLFFITLGFMLRNDYMENDATSTPDEFDKSEGGV